MMAEVDGEGFTPNDTVHLFVDGQLAGQSQVDGAGKYAIVFPLAGRPGAHFVKTMDDHGNQAFSFFDIFTEAGPIVGDLNGDGQVDIFDAIMVARNFGKTDPTMTTPGAAQQFTLGLSTFALALAIPLVTIELLKRTHKKSKPKT